MMRYYFVGDVTLYLLPKNIRVRVSPGCGGSCEAASDAEAVACWWAMYRSRKPELRSEDPATVIITREDGSTFPLAPHLYRC